MPYANGKTLLDLLNIMIRQKNIIGSEAFHKTTTSSINTGHRKSNAPMGSSSPINVVDQEYIGAFISRQMLEAIRFLHTHGVVHSDIKPNNWVIKWDPNGCRCGPGGGLNDHYTHTQYGIQLCLIDFGKAKQIRVTTSNEVQINTTMYMDNSGDSMDSVDSTSPGLSINTPIQYVGNCAAKSMACPQQLTKQAWDLQPDYYGIACCMHNILYYEEMSVTTECIYQSMRSRGFVECVELEDVLLQGESKVHVPRVALKRYVCKCSCNLCLICYVEYRVYI